jgi:predicted unusual protein kinase regulating ubiquinone biosynthesis (AarF/ABC1/UbiB family)
MADNERNRFGARIGRIARVGAGITSAALGAGSAKLFGGEEADREAARAITAALGDIKGPLMKVAQIVSTIPDFLPPEYAEELSRLQAEAPAMGRAFVRRRMRSELGPDWASQFAEFDEEAAHAASLGQVHRAVLPDGRKVAVKLQYPDMQSAVESDIRQLRTLLGVVHRVERSVDASAAIDEVSDRLREELDYRREASAARLFAHMLKGSERVVVPQVMPNHSTGRLLTMEWLDGEKLTAFENDDQTSRNEIAKALFAAWWGPFYGYGVVHGDPHLGNYLVARNKDGSFGLKLLDFGCIRIFTPQFVSAPILLFHALRDNDRAAMREAYRLWGFDALDDSVIDTLNIWAGFLYGPLMDNRVRTIADGILPQEYGRREVFEVRKRLKEQGRVRIPREFVFMDRAAIGVGAALLRLRAELNFHELYMDAIAGFDPKAVETRQVAALRAAGLEAD